MAKGNQVSKKTSGNKNQRKENNLRVSNLANKITLARILLIPIFVIILLSDMKYHNIIATIVFAIISLSDFLDGHIARRRGEVSVAGAMLDPLADKLLVSAALIFLIGKGVAPWMAYTIIAREFLITGLRSLAWSKHEDIPVRWSGKIKTTVQLIAIGAVILSIPYSNVLMYMATILTLYSGIEYLWLGRRFLKGSF